jgi:hypothetical protein
MTDLEAALREELAKLTGYPPERLTGDTRVWHDAGLAGDDFEEFVAWLYREHGFVLPGPLADFAPPESDLLDPLSLPPPFRWLDDLLWPWRRRRTYRELRLRDIAAHIRASGASP